MNVPVVSPICGRLALCRPGFERECVQELEQAARAAGLSGYARAREAGGYAEFILHDGADAGALTMATQWNALIFARQALDLIARLDGLDPVDRIGPLLVALSGRGECFGDIRIEHTDSDAGRELSGLARSLTPPLRTALQRAHLLDTAAPRHLHVLLLAGDSLILAAAAPAASAPDAGGIPRLRFPAGAPSRSTLKLEEALLVLLSDRERERWLRAGMTAVDLGAAPGGWTFQLVRRSLRVIAVDNGPMDRALLDSGLVEHRREDGFRFRPARPVDWLVCDMVEQPRRIAALMAAWLSERCCRHALFNLKLPMKKRLDEVRLCLALIRDTVPGIELRARQLYHDREEITVLAVPST